MIRAERIWRQQRASGRVAMVLLGLALLTFFDGLRGGILGNSGQIRLIPGERYAVSGPLPPKTERIEDFVIEGNAPDGTVRLVPEGIFTGYLFGGGMWRGHLAIDRFARPGLREIRVRDRFGEKQNPALVFNVRVFAGAPERRAQSPSLVMRWFGFPPLVLAACLVLPGLMIGGLNYLLGRKWHAVLAAHGCGEVFRVRRAEGRLEAVVELGGRAHAPVGAPFRFTHPVRGDLGFGTVLSREDGRITVEVQDNAPVRPGDIACPATV